MPEIKLKTNNENDSFIKKEEPQKVKLFANKKLNIALIVIGALILLAFVAAVVIPMIPASSLA